MIAAMLIPLLSPMIVAAGPIYSSDVVSDCDGCPPIATIDTTGSNLKPFMMSIFEVRWVDYLRAVREAGCAYPSNEGNDNIRSRQDGLADHYPVTGVIVDNFLCYTTWLAKKSGKKYRLATPEEWLWAARNAPDAMQNWDSLDRARAAAKTRNDPRAAVRDAIVRVVGQGAPSRDGIYDLEGNAGEATSGTRPGKPQICRMYGKAYCRGVQIFGLGDLEKPDRYRESGFALQGYSDVHYGYRVVRNK